MARLRGAGLRHPDCAQGHRGHRRQDRRLAGQGRGQRALRGGAAGQPDQHHRTHAHRAIRDRLPGDPWSGGLAFGALLPAERFDVRQPPRQGDRQRGVPGSRLPHGPRELHSQLRDVRPDRRLARSGHILRLQRCLAADGLTQPCAIQHAHGRRRSRGRGHLPERVPEPQWSAAGTVAAHPEAPGLPA